MLVYRYVVLFCRRYPITYCIMLKWRYLCIITHFADRIFWKTANDNRLQVEIKTSHFVVGYIQGKETRDFAVVTKNGVLALVRGCQDGDESRDVHILTHTEEQPLC